MISDAARVQSALWGGDPEGWARFAETHNRPLFEAVLDATGVQEDTQLLDVGCGTGLTLTLAAERRAKVSGVDITEALLDIARERLPDADLRVGDMQSLPFDDAAFDVVLGVNSFQFAGDPVRALAEAARVCRPGGAVAASLFAAPERSESTAVHHALSALSPPEQEAEHAPYALSEPGNLEAAMEAAGLTIEADGEVPLAWAYASMDDAVRGLMSSAGAARAIRSAGADRVRAVLIDAMAPFQRPTGAVAMNNTFRWVAGRRV
ncbi:MAG TPA: class I SAM-dependent methyltransferase [Thermoleophilaceae bacterium]|nr:class I SAM-dependent methyltransferase [Thermoleophilaceae bacterium]